MTRPHALSLDDHQLKVVLMASRLLPPECRDWFLASLSDSLRQHPHPDDYALQRAITATLASARIPVPLYLFDPPTRRSQA